MIFTNANLCSTWTVLKIEFLQGSEFLKKSNAI